ncbi:MAG: hypothetical protein EB059_05210 [Alphaproteobacteria bacterium]|nr:hypothetical protein [Alphaproteobacteria bacterium]
MADTTTSLTPAQKIKANTDAIIKNYYLLKDLKNAPKVTPDPFDKEPPKNIRGYKQSSTDVKNDSALNARTIGDLTKGKTRLNIISALTKDDKVDFFKFNATVDEKLGIAVTTDKGVRIQILDSKGRVFADSEAKKGILYDNFQSAGGQKLDIKKGTYYLKVTRDTGDLNTVTPNYAIQVSTTRYYEKDYDTTETPARKVSYATSGAYSAGGINDLLAQFNGGLFDSANGTYYSKKV